MIPKNIDREHIIRAIREIDSDGVPPSRESRNFFLSFEGREYPPKYVLSLANKFANGEELHPSEFSGGQETNSFLQRLGFDIAGAPQVKVVRKPATPKRRAARVGQTRHDERCPNCKETIRRMLKAEYGDVKYNHRIKVSAGIKDYKNRPFYPELKKIYSELQNCRGHKEFVRAEILPNCDFFVPNPGFDIEFDESQHFTLPRKIYLQNYPHNLK